MNRYDSYSKAFQDIQCPFAYIDMDLLDRNIGSVLKRSGSKKIRIATKSVRSLEILKYIETKLQDKFNGYMCFSAKEAIWLSSNGLDNLLIAYPSMDRESIVEISKLTTQGKSIYLMVDSVEHIDFLKSLQIKDPLHLCLDIDLSTHFPGLNFGVFRSPLKSAFDAKNIVQAVERSRNLHVKSVMGYEAQIAGVTDNQKGRFFTNLIIKILKRLSLQKVSNLRKSVVDRVLELGVELDFVNGGGTGSMESTRLEDSVTEIAVGSGFYSPTLFDSYCDFKHEGAAGFGLEIIRRPTNNIFTCFAGGYVASGAIGKDKAPTPYLPEGCELNSNEMACEVQTPVFYKGNTKLELGSPIFFRHAKAGELCERFNDLYLLRSGKVEKKIKTYRGEGKCFA